MNPLPPELDHPCKQTCSGWKQGRERGITEMQKREELLVKALNHYAKGAAVIGFDDGELARAALDTSKSIKQDYTVKGMPPEIKDTLIATLTLARDYFKGKTTKGPVFIETEKALAELDRKE